MIFEEFFRSPEFNSNAHDKVAYVTGGDLDNVALEIDEDLL
jgi:hypothetical protein